MMKAAIDIGSNSIRMLVGNVEDGVVQVEAQYLRTTRLGKTEKGGNLNPEAVERTLAALAEFHEILQVYGLEKNPVVAATSAVREAADGVDFKKKIADRLGWDLRILSGEEEARYSYAGAAAVAGGGGNAAVIDVGGGSTELIFPNADGKICGRSVAVGAVRLHSGEVRQADLPGVLSPLQEMYGQGDRTMNFVGVGGTITSLAAMKKGLTVYSRAEINGTALTKAELAAYYNELTALKSEEILCRYPLLQNREDIITEGIAIYLALAELLGFDEIIVSDAGILDGLLPEA